MYLVLLAVILTSGPSFVMATQVIQAPYTPLEGINQSEPAAEVTGTTPLLFLGNQNIAPVVYLDGSTPKGVAVDIVHALAAHLSQPMEIRAMDWPEAQALVAQGNADALIQINPTEERKKIYDFSDPLLESHFSIFTRADSIGISGITSLRGLRVGVEPGGLPKRLLEQDPQVRLTTIPNFTEGFKQLNEGSIDAVVVDYRVGSYVLAKNGIRNIKVTGDPVASSYSSIAVKKGNTKLLNEINNALQIIRADGTYQKIIDNWQPTETVFETQEQITNRIYYIIILILVVLFLVAVIWTVTVRKELLKRKAAEEALRISEGRLRTLVQTIPDLVWLKDTNGVYLSCNTIFERFFGAREADILGKTDYHFVDRELAEIFREQDRKALAEGKPTTNEEWVTFADDGHRVYLETIKTPMYDTGGKVIAVLGIGRDITQRKKDEEELQALSRELEQRVLDRTADLTRSQEALYAANKKLNLLSGITRHDILNQLTVLIGYTELLERKQPDPLFSPYFNKITSAAERIQAMIQFTKTYESVGVNAPVWQNTRTLVDTSAKELALGDVRLLNDIPADLMIFADPLIIKVFYNLIANSVRYGVTITTIRFSALESGDDCILVCEDDGVGIPKEEKEKIFERGFGKNTGLGLFLSREILSITGITIHETGEPGKGARFEMTVSKGMYR
jgi:PAS domain S-box-containing protein